MTILALFKIIFLMLWPFLFLLIPYFRDKEKFIEKVKKTIKSD